jgi:glycosyltransferase involved in cell wall biosynthesis
LSRVLPLERRGFYVDVGAVCPGAGSLTELFYVHGWSGVNTAVGPELDELVAKRPRDINLRVVIGRHAGMERVITEGRRAADVHRRTLADVVEEHSNGRPIDFLRVGAKQDALEVISSADLVDDPPAVVVVELTGTGPESWARLLNERGYVLAVLEAGTCFYVPEEAVEHRLELARPWSEGDRFVRNEERRLLEENAELKDLLALAPGADLPVGELERLRTETEFERLTRGRTVVRPPTGRDAAARLAEVAANRMARSTRALWSRARRQVVRVQLRPDGRQGPPHARVGPAEAVSLLHDSGPWSFDPPSAQARGPDDEELGSLEETLTRAVLAPDEDTVSELATAFGSLGIHSDEHVLWPAEKRDAVKAVESAVRVLRDVVALPGHEPGHRAGGDLLVDARCLQDERYRGRGIGRHARSVLDAIARHAATDSTESRLLILTDLALPPLEPRPEDHVTVIDKHEVRDLGPLQVFVQLSPLTADSECLLPAILGPAVLRCAVVYDLIPLAHPNHYLRRTIDRVQYFARLAVLARYDRLLAISGATAAALSELLGRAHETVFVTGVAAALGDAPDERPLSPAESDVREDRRPYVLVPSGTEARKNLPSALGALAVARRSGRGDLRLAAYGSVADEMKREALSLAETLGLGADDVSFLPHLSDSQLEREFREASVTVVPSFDEGFSIPVAESLTCGTAVVGSDIPAHRELIGSGWWLVPPSDTEALGRALLAALEAGPELAATQRETLGDRADLTAVPGRVEDAIWGSGLSSRGERAGPSETRKPASTRRTPRLAVLTPWPPQLSGVADYSAFTLGALADQAEVTVFSASEAAGRHGAVSLRPLTADPYLDRRFDRVIAVLGNSPFHIPMLEYLADFGGACIAHDDRMLDVYLRRIGTEATAELMSTDERPVAAREVVQFLSDLDRLPNRGFGWIARQADPLVVHSATLSRRLYEETGIQPRVVPFVPYNRPSLERVTSRVIAEARRRCAMKDDELQIVTFGIVDLPTKGVDLLVQALGWLDSWGVSSRLHVLGPVPEESFHALRALAIERDVLDRLRIYGAFSWTTHRMFLLAADVGVQLRLSSVLTISGTAADCAAFGLPTLASRSVAEEMQLPSYVHRVPDKVTGLLLAEAIAELADYRHSRTSDIERDRRGYLDRFSARSYAEGLLEALELEGTPRD